ncbi:DNA repair protein [Escherichia coli]|uniref:P-loop ATPase, Sll1717 family n=1 Tax=Escherichia coli TaxID=562 RepID=UPI000E1DCE05|nr:DNA repair protein [Escherichia coli]MED9207814.1 DNA repair protein [Escherichia marmotae]EFI9719802.1 DNA repair protein [Escherichia coli]EFO6313327.1 DNA repair protein [Escherichia coli]EHN0182070.1 DNA repair protein [Escherichia coli]EHN0202820.1 DNA repair protein [Escherichia coli]
MAHNPITIRQNFKIGELDAESDSVLLDSCFIDSGYLNKLLDPYDNSSIIRGRTGAGKSALLHMVMNHAYKCRRLDPNDISIRFLEQSDIIAFFEALNVNLDMFYKILWRHILIMELLKLRHDIRSETDTNNFFSGIMSRLKKDEVKKKAIEYFREWGDKFWIDTDAHLKEITRKLEQDTKASIGGELKGVALNAEYAKKLTEEQILDVKKRAMEVVSGLQIKKLNEILALLADYSFDDPQKKYFIIIDQLDENWAENETRYKFIRALIEEIKVFRKIKNIKIIVALRLDLLRSVFNLTRGSGFQEEKYESYILDIKWTPEQLTELVQKRVSEVYRRQYTRENVKIQDIFPKPKGGPTGLTPLEYIIERTLLRPRDVLQYVNECFSIALDRERISWGTIQKAESAYSQKRLRSLKEEWGDIYPSFEETVEILRNLPDRFSRNEILRNNIDAVITELSVQGTHDPCAVSANKMLNGENREADVINEILLCVYNLGIVGFKVSSLTPYKWSFRDSTPATKNEIKRASGMKIHKMLHSALDIRINAEKRFEKEKEELENEADND